MTQHVWHGRRKETPKSLSNSNNHEESGKKKRKLRTCEVIIELVAVLILIVHHGLLWILDTVQLIIGSKRPRMARST